MTRDDIIKLAREAGYAIRQFDGVDEVMDGDNYHIQTDNVEKFAALVAAAELDKCCELLEGMHAATTGSHNYYLHAAVELRRLRKGTP